MFSGIHNDGQKLSVLFYPVLSGLLHLIYLPRPSLAVARFDLGCIISAFQASGGVLRPEVLS